MLHDSLQDPECDDRYSLRRLELFHEEYMRRSNAKQIAPPGSQWQRDNQYSYSMFLTNEHNSDIHAKRVANEGVLPAEFEEDEELKGTALVQTEVFDANDLCEYPCAANFLDGGVLREVSEQPPPTIPEIAVAFPMQPDCQRLQEMVMIDKSRLFMAKPPPSTVAEKDLSFWQQRAIELATDPNTKILYLCGKAGTGKTEVALRICEIFSGRVQAGAGKDYLYVLS